MMHPDLAKIKYIGVLDIGCSNTVVYYLNLNNAGRPYKLIPLMDDIVAPTVMLKTPSGATIIGQKLEAIDFKSFMQGAEITIDFKSVPNENTRNILITYLRALKEKITKNWPKFEINPDEVLWYTGCPNAWQNSEILQNFQKVFCEAGFTNICIVPECKAAMVYHLKLDETGNATKKITIDEVTKAQRQLRLSIDVGAYSNGATLVSRQGIKTCGNVVGAHIIDMMIVCANLYMNLENEFDVEAEPTDSSFLDALRTRFEEDASFRNFLFIQGRRVKEEYFKANAKDYNITETTVTITLDEYEKFKDSDGDYIRTYSLAVNEKMINRLIGTYKVKEVLGENLFISLSEETRNELGDNTWQGCFAKFIGRILEEFPEFKAQIDNPNANPKPMVILTGGASSMPVVDSIVLNTFKLNYEHTYDSNPLLAIANGLAEYGAERVRAERFDKLKNKLTKEKYDSGKTLAEYYANNAFDIFTHDFEAFVPMEYCRIIELAKKAWLEKLLFSGSRIDFCTEIAYRVEQYIPTNLPKKLSDNINKIAEQATDNFWRWVTGAFEHSTGRFGFDTFYLKKPKSLKNGFVSEINNTRNNINNYAIAELSTIEKFFRNFDNNICGFFTNRRNRWNESTEMEYRFAEVCNEYEKKIAGKVKSELEVHRQAVVKHLADTFRQVLRDYKNNSNLWIHLLDNPSSSYDLR